MKKFRGYKMLHILTRVVKNPFVILVCGVGAACANPDEARAPKVIQEIAEACEMTPHLILFDEPETKRSKILTLSLNYRMRDELPEKRLCVRNWAIDHKIRIVDEKVLTQLETSKGAL